MSEDSTRIRPMQSTDCAQVAELAGHQIQPATVLREIEESLAELRRRPDHALFVAVDATSRILGWVQVIEIRPLLEPAYAMIHTLIESEAGRAEAVGKRLRKVCETWAMERGHRQIVYGSKRKALELLEQEAGDAPNAAPGLGGPWPEKVVMYTDGASRGNPGAAAIGVHVVSPQGETLAQLSEALGTETNNVAEYTALLRGLELARHHQAREVLVRADSELMIRQMLGQYKVKSEGLIPLFNQCRNLVRAIGRVRFEHVRREFNTIADALANQALDR